MRIAIIARLSSHIRWTDYPQVLRQFNCLGDVLFADMLYGKYFVSIHSGGVVEIWQFVPKIKAVEHIVFPAEIGTLTTVHRIKVSA